MRSTYYLESSENCSSIISPFRTILLFKKGTSMSAITKCVRHIKLNLNKFDEISYRRQYRPIVHTIYCMQADSSSTHKHSISPLKSDRWATISLTSTICYRTDCFGTERIIRYDSTSVQRKDSGVHREYTVPVYYIYYAEVYIHSSIYIHSREDYLLYN